VCLLLVSEVSKAQSILF